MTDSPSPAVVELLTALADCLVQCEPFELLAAFNIVAEGISEELGVTPEMMLKAHKHLIEQESRSAKD